MLLNCPHEHLVSLRTQHRQLVFPPQYEDSPNRLRTFMNQPDMYGVASFVTECLALLPGSFALVTGFFQASAQMPPRGIYSDVTLPCSSRLLPVHQEILEKTGCENV
jgi:hypothetical protein